MKKFKHRILKIMVSVMMLTFLLSAAYTTEPETSAAAGDTSYEQLQEKTSLESNVEDIRSELGAIERKIYTVAVILCIINLAVTMFIFGRLRKRNANCD